MSAVGSKYYGGATSSGGPEAVRDRNSHVNKIFIGGLSPDTTKDDVEQYFSKYGEIIDAVVMTDPTNNRSRGFGFVKFTSLEQVDQVQKERDHIINGKQVETKRATPKGQGVDTNSAQSKKVFVGGVPNECSKEDLQKYAEDNFGTVEDVYLNTQNSRHYAFITFADYDFADKMILQSEHKIKDQPVIVNRAQHKNNLRQPMMMMPPQGPSSSRHHLNYGTRGQTYYNDYGPPTMNNEYRSSAPPYQNNYRSQHNQYMNNSSPYSYPPPNMSSSNNNYQPHNNNHYNNNTNTNNHNSMMGPNQQNTPSYHQQHHQSQSSYHHHGGNNSYSSNRVPYHQQQQQHLMAPPPGHYSQQPGHPNNPSSPSSLMPNSHNNNNMSMNYNNRHPPYSHHIQQQSNASPYGSQTNHYNSNNHHHNQTPYGSSHNNNTSSSTNINNNTNNANISRGQLSNANSMPSSVPEAPYINNHPQNSLMNPRTNQNSSRHDQMMSPYGSTTKSTQQSYQMKPPYYGSSQSLDSSNPNLGITSNSATNPSNNIPISGYGVSNNYGNLKNPNSSSISNSLDH